ncbi:mediator of RNA polymerase II transcription subunit 15-like [Drosophila obscura]|uniref:mediator of RNA polymerase II transcription subunit 15-like n=1 Tax=Drosophila obscura TaxID=7282 RepID=UPI001BB11475|nr:mediator of RNA polymerase II transcription subunit 15-like [Drosophila obscura]
MTTAPDGHLQQVVVTKATQQPQLLSLSKANLKKLQGNVPPLLGQKEKFWSPTPPPKKDSSKASTTVTGHLESGPYQREAQPPLKRECEEQQQQHLQQQQHPQMSPRPVGVSPAKPPPQSSQGQQQQQQVNAQQQYMGTTVLPIVSIDLSGDMPSTSAAAAARDANGIVGAASQTGASAKATLAALGFTLPAGTALRTCWRPAPTKSSQGCQPSQHSIQGMGASSKVPPSVGVVPTPVNTLQALEQMVMTTQAHGLPPMAYLSPYRIPVVGPRMPASPSPQQQQHHQHMAAMQQQQAQVMDFLNFGLWAHPLCNGIVGAASQTGASAKATLAALGFTLPAGTALRTCWRPAPTKSSQGCQPSQHSIQGMGASSKVPPSVGVVPTPVNTLQALEQMVMTTQAHGLPPMDYPSPYRIPVVGPRMPASPSPQQQQHHQHMAAMQQQQAQVVSLTKANLKKLQVNVPPLLGQKRKCWSPTPPPKKDSSKPSTTITGHLERYMAHVVD